MLYVHICFYNEEKECVINRLKNEMTVHWKWESHFQLFVEDLPCLPTGMSGYPSVYLWLQEGIRHKGMS